jgi:AcrR family transcriptional regulator
MGVGRLSRAERREHTRDGLIAVADRLFVAGGFHATTLDQIAAAAGYTKGAVYSNFASKEDLFFAVYERRAARTVANVDRLLDEHGPAAGLERLAADTSARRGRDDGWLAVFFEFWAHVIRHPEYRARFAEIHARLQRPVAAAMERVADEHGVELPVGSLPLAVATNAMQVGLALERLTQPEVVDDALGGLMARLVLEDLERSKR